MRKPLRTQEEASRELDQAAVWYEERNLGLGRRFLESVDGTLEEVVRFPRAGAPVPGVAADLEVRRAPIKGFPYHVIYLETPEDIHILAFAHDRRRPGYWVTRTAGPGE